MTDPLQNAPQAAPAATPAAAPVAVDPVAPWKSKTLWASFIIAALPLVPGVGPALQQYAGANPQIVLSAVGAVFAALRLVTEGRIGLKK